MSLRREFFAGLPQAHSAAYLAYNAHVTGCGGSIYSPTTTEKGLKVAAGIPGLVQWLDARFGYGGTLSLRSTPGGNTGWYSIVGTSLDVDAVKTYYGNAGLVIDATLKQPCIEAGAWDAGVTPDLYPADNYTWGMRYYMPAGGANGLFWGNRYGNTKHPGSNVWNFLYNTYWRNYWDANTDFYFVLPEQTWEWVWLVKKYNPGSSNVEFVLYDSQNNVLATTAGPIYMGELPIGLGGGTDSTAISTNLRYQTFVRAASALTAAQRKAIQAI